jgi:radical SAM protein with 4Fe4S-binding SPASM domain
MTRYPLYTAFLLKRKIRFWNRYRWIHSNRRPDGQVPPPLVYKLYLTLQCNLHCGMCMFWGNQGVRELSGARESAKELDWDVVERIFREEGKRRPSFILSGGEPLLYSRFNALAALLKQYRCFAYICTNGTLVEKHLLAIRDNPFLVFYLSVDGPREINDRLRGSGVYDATVSAIKSLKKLNPKPYVGVQFTLQPENVHSLHQTCKEMIALGADWILVNLQWVITPRQAAAYEAVIQKEYGIMPKSHKVFLLPYNLDKEEFIRQCRNIRSEKWPIQISSYLKKPEDIYQYVDHPEINPYNQFCYKEWLRMDVLPDGRVTPCIQYPDITFGSLNEYSVMDIWNGKAFKHFRKRICEEPLPVCSRCYCLYLYDAQRQVL